MIHPECRREVVAVKEQDIPHLGTWQNLTPQFLARGVVVEPQVERHTLQCGHSGKLWV
jgi:hypothetical protein